MTRIICIKNLLSTIGAYKLNLIKLKSKTQVERVLFLLFI